FAGADATTTLELLMPDGRALQGCTSHDLGQNFSKTFDIKFQGKDGSTQYAWQTSWGFTTRSVGALVMVHGDQKGLRLPPKIAPTQVVIVPIPGKNNIDSAAKSREIAETLSENGVRVLIDDSDSLTPGAKFNKWEKKGVPVRIEIGDREALGQTVVVYRRDEDKKYFSSVNFIGEDIPNLLDQIQENMLAQAEKFLEANTHEVGSYDKFKEIMTTSRGMIKAFWCEDAGCEENIKTETKASTRCLPFGSEEEHGQCVYCNKEATHRWIFAQSY
ncbi:MAG: His/Gly/Thr/Pro-type tRNA ligase C-terminal domain-containing protein, partial [Patescibacteria group bacterium]